MKFEIYYKDLIEEAQQDYDNILESRGYASDTKNDEMPLAVLEIEPKQD